MANCNPEISSVTLLNRSTNSILFALQFNDIYTEATVEYRTYDSQGVASSYQILQVVNNVNTLQTSVTADCTVERVGFRLTGCVACPSGTSASSGSSASSGASASSSSGASSSEVTSDVTSSDGSSSQTESHSSDVTASSASSTDYGTSSQTASSAITSSAASSEGSSSQTESQSSAVTSSDGSSSQTQSQSSAVTSSDGSSSQTQSQSSSAASSASSAASTASSASSAASSADSSAASSAASSADSSAASSAASSADSSAASSAASSAGSSDDGGSSSAAVAEQFYCVKSIHGSSSSSDSSEDSSGSSSVSIEPYNKVPVQDLECPAHWSLNDRIGTYPCASGQAYPSVADIMVPVADKDCSDYCYISETTKAFMIEIGYPEKTQAEARNLFNKSSFTNFSMSNHYLTALQDAADIWGDLIKLNQNWGRSSVPTIALNALSTVNDGSAGWIARCGPSSAYSHGGILYNSASFNLWINEYYDPFTGTDPYSQNAWKWIMVHELGHALGLGTLWSTTCGYCDGVVHGNSHFMYSVHPEFSQQGLYPDTVAAYRTEKSLGSSTPQVAPLSHDSSTKKPLLGCHLTDSPIEFEYNPNLTVTPQHLVKETVEAQVHEASFCISKATYLANPSVYQVMGVYNSQAECEANCASSSSSSSSDSDSSDGGTTTSGSLSSGATTSSAGSSEGTTTSGSLPSGDTTSSAGSSEGTTTSGSLPSGDTTSSAGSSEGTTTSGSLPSGDTTSSAGSSEGTTTSGSLPSGDTTSSAGSSEGTTTSGSLPSGDTTSSAGSSEGTTTSGSLPSGDTTSSAGSSEGTTTSGSLPSGETTSSAGSSEGTTTSGSLPSGETTSSAGSSEGTTTSGSLPSGETTLSITSSDATTSGDVGSGNTTEGSSSEGSSSEGSSSEGSGSEGSSSVDSSSEDSSSASSMTISSSSEESESGSSSMTITSDSSAGDSSGGSSSGSSSDSSSSDSSSASDTTPTGPDLPEPQGDVHIGWPSTGLGSVLSAPVFMDDNLILSGSITGATEEDGTPICLQFDHWCIDHIEYDAQGNFQGALLSKRDQFAVFPDTTVVSAVQVIGNPRGATINGDFKPFMSAGKCPCGCDNFGDTWGSYSVSIQWHELSSLGSYGGYYWELLETIGGATIGPYGWTGAVGPNQSSIGGGNRTTVESPTQADVEAAASAGRSGTSSDLLFAVIATRDDIDSTSMDLVTAKANREQAYISAGYSLTATDTVTACCVSSILDVALANAPVQPACLPCEETGFQYELVTEQDSNGEWTQSGYNDLACVSGLQVVADGNQTMGSLVNGHDLCSTGGGTLQWNEANDYYFQLCDPAWQYDRIPAQYTLKVNGSTCLYNNNGHPVNPSQSDPPTCPCRDYIPASGTTIEYIAYSTCDTPTPIEGCHLCIEE